MEKITKSSDKVLIDPNEPLILPDGTALVGRVEWFLYALCCLDYQNLPTPMSRIEEFANALITGEVPNIEPQSRAEQFFLAILDGNVSDLPQPQSRSEVLLDKLARGEFDLSDVEPIQSSYELLLAYLIKNGGIGNIDYVLYEFSEAMKTMYNTVEKPFKSLELSGNTLVNCVLEDTENDDYTSFDKDYSGTSFTINGTSEGAIKSAILKGQTLVNLLDRNNMSLESLEYTFVDGIFNVTTERNWGKMKFNPILASNKKYILFIGSSYKDCMIYYRVASGMATLIGHAVNAPIIFTTPSEQIANISIEFPTAVVNETVSYPMLLEYQEGMENWDIPYFEGMQSVKVPVLSTIGKNLISMNNFRSYYNGEILFCNTNSITFNAPNDWAGVFVNLSLKPNTEYHISYECQNDNTIKTIIRYLNDDETLTGATYGGENNFSFMTKDNGKVRVSIESNTIQDNIVLKNIQLEEGSSATPYEPYKSNILSCNEEVELRGVGDVKDILNCLTGELTERVGEIVFDGSDDEGWGVASEGDTINGFSIWKNIDNAHHKGLVCDKLSYFDYSDLKNDKTQFISCINQTRVIIVNIKGLTSVDEVKQWLSENPITVQYQLATESIKTVDLNVVDQNNTKIDKIHVFNETTHVNASSDELTPTVNIGKSVSYPTIIKPNTKYTVDLKRNNKPLTVDLGGTEVTFADGETRKTITTPSTLVNDKLSYYGIGAKCNEIMLIEGEIERNIDYFTGMQSFVMQNQMPILSTVGKNLANADNYVNYPSENMPIVKDGENSYIIENKKVGSWQNRCVDKIKLKANTTYTLSYDSEVLSASVPMMYATVLNLRNDLNTTINVSGDVSPNNPRTFTPTQDMLVRLCMYVTDMSGGINRIKFSNIQLEESSNRTAYEPYKSSILSCNEDVTLRGIGDTQDELDCLTGEVIERIGEIVLDGSEDWNLVKSLTNSTMFGAVGLPITSTNGTCITDKINSTYSATVDNNNIYIESNVIYITILNANLQSIDTTGFKQWLQKNSITIQYKLANPIIRTVDLNVIDQDGNTIPKIKSYKDVTHLEVTVPKQSLLPHISAEVATDNSKDMSLLTTKHQKISETQSTIQDNIQSQSDEIDTALMATTEIFESILE